MSALGGYATLEQLYAALDFSSWKTKTPQASVRRIVRNSPECFRIVPRLWALKSMRDKISGEFDFSEGSEFSHAYYQGLVCKIGAMKKLKTYVPAQDKNKKILGLRLAEIASTTVLPQFAYPQILKRAKSVDVIWFRPNAMPAAFFEIEHTTDMRNSLGKFCDLRDFYAQFHIVAPARREVEFREKIGGFAFSEIKSRVKFFSYEALADQYEAESK